MAARAADAGAEGWRRRAVGDPAEAESSTNRRQKTTLQP